MQYLIYYYYKRERSNAKLCYSCHSNMMFRKHHCVLCFLVNSIV